MICVDIIQTETTAFIAPVSAQYPNCAYVLTTPAEVSPWVLTTEQALEITAVIGVLWGVAFVFRVFTRYIQYSR